MVCGAFPTSRHRGEGGSVRAQAPLPLFPGPALAGPPEGASLALSEVGALLMQVNDLSINDLLEAPWNPNQGDSAMLARLSESISRYGIVQNLVVRPLLYQLCLKAS